MAAQKGSDFLVKIDTTGAGSFSTVAGMRSTGMTINNEMVEITTKGGDKWRELIEAAGIQTMTLTLAGVFKDDASEEKLRSVATANTLNDYELFSGNGDKYAGSFQVSSYERTGEHNGEEVYSVTLESAGTITFTGA